MVAVTKVFSIGTFVFELVAKAIKPNADIPPGLIILYPIMQATSTSNIPPMTARVNNNRLSMVTGFFDCLVETCFLGRLIFSDRDCDCFGLIADLYNFLFASER